VHPPSHRTARKWWHAVNYAARALLILVGLLLALGSFPVAGSSQTFLRTFGVVMALFGLYRVLWYRWRLRQWQRDEADNSP